MYCGSTWLNVTITASVSANGHHCMSIFDKCENFCYLFCFTIIYISCSKATMIPLRLDVQYDYVRDCHVAIAT
jgi:hypothetical protein